MFGGFYAALCIKSDKYTESVAAIGYRQAGFGDSISHRGLTIPRTKNVVVLLSPTVLIEGTEH